MKLQSIIYSLKHTILKKAPRTSQKYYILLILLLTIRLEAAEWKYLSSESFKTRYVLAAYFLKDCEKILEIGGYKTPIDQFVDDTKTVLVIDPLLPTKTKKNVTHLSYFFNQWEGSLDGNYGVLILGLGLKNMNSSSWNKLYHLINNSQVTVIGFPLDWSPSVDQFNHMLPNIRKEIKMQFLLDLSGNNFGDLSNSYPPRTLRKLYVFE